MIIDFTIVRLLLYRFLDYHLPEIKKNYNRGTGMASGHGDKTGLRVMPKNKA